MEDKKNLDDLIKSSFDKINQRAPDSLWGNLSSALDTDTGSPQTTEKHLRPNAIDTKVKESFSNLYEKMPKDAWTSINRQLNIERVWDNISHDLDKTKPLLGTKTRIAATLLLLLLSSTAIYLFSSKDAVNLKIADRQEKNISNSGEPSVAYGLEEAIEDGEKTKEQKTGLISQAEIWGRETLPADKSTSTNSNFSKGDQKKGFEEESNIIYQKKKSNAPEKMENLGDAKNPSLLGSKQGSTLQPPSVFLIGNGPENKKLSVNNSSASSTAMDLNKSISNIKNSAFIPALEETDELRKEQRSINNTLSAKVSRPPLVPEEKDLFIKEETISLDSFPLVQFTVPFLQDDSKKNKDPNIRNFEAGPVWVFHNSWLLNNETRNSFDENSLISTDASYKQHWGLAVNYKLTGKSILATEIHFLSKIGQQYKMYGEGEYLKKGLELRYNKIVLQYQRNLMGRGTVIPSWFTVKAGIYGGLLHEKLGEIREEESRYSRFDYGLRLALGQENKLGRIVLGYGFSTERGFKNVFRGTEKIPAAYNKTYIQNFGTYVNVRYVF